MKDSKVLIYPLHAWYSHKQSKVSGFAQYLTEQNKRVYVTNVDLSENSENIDSLKVIYPDLQYVGVVRVLEDVFAPFLRVK